MNHSDIFKHIDHTLLRPTATWDEIRVLCDEATALGTACVCVPPAYVAQIRQTYGEGLRICTVIGFPLGYNSAGAKAYEAAEAVRDGADEVDMVVNLCDVKNGAFEKVLEEIQAVKHAVCGCVLKVIVETCYLTEAEKIALCRCVTAGGADYIKTSTGFGTGGAVLEDIHLFKKHIGPHVRIKAAGGIRSLEDMEHFLAAGCDRIGTSSAVSLLKGGAAESY